MLLRPGPFGGGVVFPVGDELFRGHGGGGFGERRSIGMPLGLGNVFSGRLRGGPRDGESVPACLVGFSGGGRLDEPHWG